MIRRNAVRLIALAAVLVSYGMTRLPSLSDEERGRLAERFRFASSTLPVLGDVSRNVRPVHPDLAHIAAWISSVGGAVALHDLDGDGLPNDICHVDVRNDLVVVSPAPGTGERFPPFPLEPAGLRYDSGTTAPMGSVPGDFNEDGRADILVYYWGRTPVLFLKGPGTPAAEAYRAVELTDSGERWYTNAATAADLDGDGHPDLVFGNYFQDDSWILDAGATDTARMQHSMSRAFNAGTNRVFLWTGSDPLYRDASEALDPEVARAWTLAAGARDLDGDLLPEIYFANDFGPDRLLHNLSEPGSLRFRVLEGKKLFTTPTSKVLGHDSFKGMGVDFGDVNGDAIPDIYVSNIAAEYSLEESHFLYESTGELEAMADGRAPYRDRSEPRGVSRSGWGWDTRLDDFDNDGVPEAVQATGFVRGKVNRWPELHEIAMGNDDLLRFPASWHRFAPGDDLSGRQHNPFFTRSGSGRYFDVAPLVGLGEEQVTRGIATADVDGDGDLDLAVGNQWEDSRFYHNQVPDPGAFLGLHLVVPLDPAAPFSARAGHPETGAGRPAVGAQARLELPGGRVLIGEVDGGNGHSGVRSPDLHFGLGDLDEPVPVELRWRYPGGAVGTRRLTLEPGWHTVVLGTGGES